MKSKHFLSLIFGTFFLLGALFLVSCNKDKDPTPEEKIIEKIIDETPVDPYTIAKKLLDQAGWPEDKTLDFDLGSLQLLNYKREVVTGDIVHYSFEVQIGTNQYDKIGIHRVVKESTAGQPLVTENAFFYQHGDLKNFVGMMLPATYSPSMADDFGLAIYLAQNGVDVWGADMAWCFVPAEGTDFGWFKDYGINKAARDTRTAMAIARIARYLTGNELAKMNMAGYSSGVATAVGALDLETQLDPDEQHIKGFVSIDLAFKTDLPNLLLAWDEQFTLSQEPYDQGTYEIYLGFTLVGSLAESDPNGDSPIFPGMTNLQVALFFGCGNAFVHIPFHFWAADWVDDFPATPKYTTQEQILDFMKAAIEYQPHRFYLDYFILMGAYSMDSPYDDHLAQVKVPVLNIGAGGGFSETSKYGIARLGSTDVTHLIPSLEAPGDELIDFGHVDIFTGYNAKEMMWEGLLGWLEGH
ncbi:MAG: hypothetical protein IPL49_15415 [Saprospirales bacterium]|nr:hypothetical protein [Saprospirales bacterium]